MSSDIGEVAPPGGKQRSLPAQKRELELVPNSSWLLAPCCILGLCGGKESQSLTARALLFSSLLPSLSFPSPCLKQGLTMNPGLKD